MSIEILFVEFLTLLLIVLNTNVDGTNIKNDDNWKGPWFPYSPTAIDSVENNQIRTNSSTTSNNVLKCDNVIQDNLIGNEDDKRTSYHYLCFDERSKYDPNVTVNALIKEYYIPTSYEAPVKCLDENIIYDHYPPTFGAYHGQVPKIGVYRYLPPETWLASVANGIVVMLYHPCAFLPEVTRLQHLLAQNIGNNYLITMSQHLPSQRPIALITWGRILLMSIVEKNVIMDFIKEFSDKNVENSNLTEDTQRLNTSIPLTMS